jgi:hypothetical protein
MFHINSALLSAEMSGLLQAIQQSCSFLVGIPSNCKFDLDVYCDSSASTSESWAHSTGNLLAVEKTSGRTIKVRHSSCAVSSSCFSQPAALTLPFAQLDSTVDVAAHVVVCSLVMNTLDNMTGSASPAAKDKAHS